MANKTTEINKEEKGTNYKRKKDNSEIERQSEDKMEVEDVAITEQDLINTNNQQIMSERQSDKKDKYRKESYVLIDSKLIREVSPARDEQGRIMYKKKDNLTRYNNERSV